MFDAEKFLNDHHVVYWTEGKNCQKGWVNITCPFCDDTENHGGINIEKGYYNCWKCGHNFLETVIMELLKCHRQKACYIIRQYSTNYIPIKKETVNKSINQTDLSEFIMNLNKEQKSYLKNRNFDPDYLEKKYGLIDSGIIGQYNFRIIVPIFFRNIVVSFQGRAYKKNHIPKYMTCNKSEEAIHHKYIVYNHDNVKNKRAIIVEGITDVWRLGDGAVAIFGQQILYNQINHIIKNYKEVFIMLDPDAKHTAYKLANNLAGLVKTYIIDIPQGYKDPGDLTPEIAENFKKNLDF